MLRPELRRWPWGWKIVYCFDRPLVVESGLTWRNLSGTGDTVAFS